MHQSTEQDIVKLALRYLKGFYKFRDRSGETETSMDVRGEGGIIADGYLAFPMEDGKAFTDVILKEHIHLGKRDSKVGDEVCASFGKGRSKRLLNAILVEIDGKHYFHWHQDDTRTLCNRSRVFSKYCSLANAQDCTHCNPSLSSA